MKVERDSGKSSLNWVNPNFILNESLDIATNVFLITKGRLNF